MNRFHPGQTPTRTRWVILSLLLLISIITYIDRVNISVTARQMMPALGLTEIEMGQIFSAFVFGYALFQIPGGWLGDRWGPRRVLTLAVIWWSIFTALTAVAPTLPVINMIGIMGSLMLVRFLIGVGESAALPNFNRAVANWHPPQERGLGIGITIGGIGIGSAITPPITAWIMVNYGWQTAFYAAGALGIMSLLSFGFGMRRTTPRTIPMSTPRKRNLLAEGYRLKPITSTSPGNQSFTPPPSGGLL